MCVLRLSNSMLSTLGIVISSSSSLSSFSLRITVNSYSFREMISWLSINQNQEHTLRKQHAYSSKLILPERSPVKAVAPK